MTKWSEFPLRPQGQPWPGLNTKGGRLDPGAGFLEDGSFNQIINEGDLLQKRKGLVRGLQERFTGVVCGLFRYTDNCGVEYLVVADEDGIQVRTPFSIPSFLGSDSLPFDDFEELDATRWDPTTAYEAYLGSLQLSGSDARSSTNYVAASQLMQWFKQAAVSSYFVEINYRLVAGSQQQVASVVVKRDSLGTTYLEASIVVTETTYTLFLYRVSGGVRATLASESIGGLTLADGFLKLSYDAGTFRATATVIPSGGDIVTLTGDLTEIQDAALGQFSAIGLQRLSADEPEIESVSGGQD